MALMTGTCIGEDTGHDDEQNTQTSSSTPVINPSRRTSNDSSDQRLDSPSPRSSPIASPVVAPDASYLRTALTTVRIISLLHCPSNFNDSGIHALPLELLIRIFSFLDVRARCRACQVSWSWQHVLYSSPKLWQRLDLSNRLSLGGDKTVGKEGGRAESVLLTLLQRPVGARRFSRLTRLDMSCTDVNPQVFSNPVVQNALRSSLSHLILNGCAHMDSGSVYHLKGLTALKALEISHCEQVDDTGLEAISFFLPHLTHLNLSYLFRVTESGVNRLFRMSNLVSLNLMGCYRIKQYPWAVSDGSQRSVLPIKEMMLGEDSRIQTRGFWLLWCTFNFNTQRLASLCPFMETLRLNMVLFDLPSDGLAALVNGFPRLKHLSLVVDRAAVTALCGLADKLGNLETLEATIHIGVTADLITALVKAKAFAKLRALKFHSKHTTVFTDRTLKALITAAPTLEYLELNGDEITADGLDPIATQLGKTLQSLLVHHIRISNTTFKNLSKSMMQVRELTMTDVQQQSYSNRLRCLVDHASICNRLKKIELSSVRGFTDRDLASIPQTCPQLQWIDFTFSFTFPKTTRAITLHCPQLLYLRLCRSVPPNLSLLTPSARRQQTTTTSTRATAPPTVRRGRNSSSASSETRYTERGHGTYGHTSHKRKRKDSRCKRLIRSPISGFQASSPECRALSFLAKKGGRRLRVMDLTGNIGLTDFTLPAFRDLPFLHTVFVDSCDGITQAGVVRFAEEKWKQLKRINVRNCRNCKAGILGEHFANRGLEVDVVVDGGRAVGRRWGEES